MLAFHACSYVSIRLIRVGLTFKTGEIGLNLICDAIKPYEIYRNRLCTNRMKIYI